MLDNIMNFLFGRNNNRGNMSGIFGFKNRNRNNNLVYNLISYDEAKNMIEQNKVKLIDVRTKNEYDILHIKGAINICVADIEKKIYIYDQNEKLMIYCSSGQRARNAIQILNSLGYGNIYIWEYAALATFPFKNMLDYSYNN